MTSAIDLCNRALDEIVADGTITDFDEPSKEAQVCKRHYPAVRRSLLRAAPWGFARRQLTLTLLGSLTEGTSVQPWAYKYLYPANCLKVRYLIPTLQPASSDVVLTGDYFLNCATSYRGSPFKVANELVSEHNSRKIVLSNLQEAVAVYVVDEETVDLFDSEFQEALVAALAAAICLPISGNKELTQLKIAQAQSMIEQARASDANESMPTTDHVPDWIRARGDNGYGFGFNTWFPGSYYGWDDMHWAM